jgi:hypothetical protein
MAKKGDVSQIIPPSLLPRSTVGTPTLPAGVIRTATPADTKARIGGGGGRGTSGVSPTKQEQIQQEQVEEIGGRALTAKERVELKQEIGRASLQKAQSTGIPSLTDSEIKQVAQQYYQRVAGIPADSIVKVKGQGFSVAPDKQEEFIEKKLQRNKDIIDKLQDKVDKGISTFSEERALQAKTREQENLMDKIRRATPKTAEALTFAKKSVASTVEGLTMIPKLGIIGQFSTLIKSTNPEYRGELTRNIIQSPVRVKQFFKKGLPEVGETLRTKPIGSTAFAGTELITSILSGKLISTLSKEGKAVLKAEDIVSTNMLSGEARQRSINKALSIDEFAESVAKVSGNKDSSLATFRIKTKDGDVINVVQLSKSVEKVEDLNGVVRYIPNQAETTIYAFKQEGKGVSSLVGRAKTGIKGEEFFTEGQFVKLTPEYFRDKATLTTIFEKGRVIPAKPAAGAQRFLIESEAVIGDVQNLRNKAAKKITELQDIIRNKNIPRTEKIQKVKDLSRELTEIEAGLMKFDNKQFKKLAQEKGAIESRNLIDDTLKEIRRTKTLSGAGYRLAIKKGDVKINVIKERGKVKRLALDMGETRSAFTGIGGTRLKTYKPDKIRVEKKISIPQRLKESVAKKTDRIRYKLGEASRVREGVIDIKKGSVKFGFKDIKLPQIQRLKKISKPKISQVKKAIVSRPLTSQIVAAFSKGTPEVSFVPKARSLSLSKSVSSPFEDVTEISVGGVKPIIKPSITTSTAEDVFTETKVKGKFGIGLGERLREGTKTRTDEGQLPKERIKFSEKLQQRVRLREDTGFKQRFRFKQRVTPKPIEIKMPVIKLPSQSRQIMKSTVKSKTVLKSRPKLKTSREKVKLKFEKNIRLKSETPAKSPLNIVVGREFNPRRLALLKSSLSKKFERRISKAKELKKTGQIKSYKVFNGGKNE